MTTASDSPAPETRTGPASAVQVRGLARRWGPRWVLGGVDLDVPTGSACMLTGANGSGKTTLLRCIATALRPHLGSVTVLGHAAWPERDVVRPKIGLLSHELRLYDDLSARDNLAVWAGLGGLTLDLRAWLDRVHLPDRPDPVRTFSAGMRRRVALALVWMKQPQLWLLDEPFAALDPEGRRLVGDLVASERGRGATVIIATHHPATTAPSCDIAAHLEGGRVVWTGHPSDAPAIGGRDLEDGT